GIRKFICKKLAEKLGIPLLDRRKQGFSLPLVHWMRHELKDGLLPMLIEPRTLQRGYFKPQAVRELLDEHFHGHRDHAGILWMMLVFELWHRNFLAKHGCESPAIASCSQLNGDLTPELLSQRTGAIS